MRTLFSAIAMTLSITAGVTATPASYQQYLIPNVANDLQGAFGSIWRSELALMNVGAIQHSIIGPFCDPVSATCTSTLVLDPNGGAVPVLLPQLPGLDGAFLYVSGPPADVISEFRIRDVSRQSQTWGTELPIVATSSFRQRMDLLNIPTDPRFRLTLRVYSTGAALARVHTIGFPGQTELSVQDLPLVTPATFGQDLSLSPAYAQYTLPAIGTSDRVRLVVDQALPGGSPIFAIVTVTNNDTQQVTAVTPQPGDVGTPLAAGHWGGNGMCFDANTSAATVVYGCSDGKFAGPILVYDNHFDADGTWTTSVGPGVSTFPAHLSGELDGASLKLTIRTSIGGIYGPVNVQLGVQGPCGMTCP